jgi:LysR family nitrogen assimilation transcriptional regulator
MGLAMETRALRYFQTVAVCGSYSRGAELLHISQPAVSRTIRKLEEELKTTLLIRHGHGVSLTESGKILLERSQSILRQFDQTKAEIQGGRESPSGVISFAIPPAAGNILIPPLVERFGKEFPNVSLNVVGGFSGSIHEWLVRGRVDLACAHDPLPQRGFNIKPLVDEEVYLVGQKGAFPFKRAFARTSDLASLPLIVPSELNASHRMLDRWAAECRLPLQIKVQVDDHYITRALVSRGVGFTLLTRAGIEPDLRQREVTALPFRPRASWSLALITNTHAARSDILDAFIETIRRVTRQLVGAGGWSARLLDRE